MLLVVVDETVDVGAAMVKCLLVKLPRPSEKYMAGLHGHNITLDLVMILANTEGYNNLFGNLELSLVIEPFETVWPRMGSFD